MNNGAKWGIGCGIGCFTALIVGSILFVIGSRFILKQSVELQKIREQEELLERRMLEERGFSNYIEAQTFSIKDDIEDPTIYKGQTFELWGDCKTNICVLTQVCEIYGTVEGNLIFKGQVLKIHPNALIKGDVEANAQSIRSRGKINGSITGKYQILDQD